MSGVRPPDDWFQVRIYGEAAASPSEEERVLYAKKMWTCILRIVEHWNCARAAYSNSCKEQFPKRSDGLPNS